MFLRFSSWTERYYTVHEPSLCQVIFNHTKNILILTCDLLLCFLSIPYNLITTANSALIWQTWSLPKTFPSKPSTLTCTFDLHKKNGNNTLFQRFIICLPTKPICKLESLIKWSFRIIKYSNTKHKIVAIFDNLHRVNGKLRLCKLNVSNACAIFNI